MNDWSQARRLDELVRRFIEDSGRYREMAVPEDDESKRQALRALMNVRMPAAMDGDTLRLQDEYLAGRALEKGIVRVTDIPTVAERYGLRAPCAGQLSLWQGDITRLAADAIVNAANSAMLGCFVPLHSCIDNCIHTYAGIQLRAECAANMAALRRVHGQDYERPTAAPMLTGAYNLPAKKVVHVVGPIVDGPLTREHERDLASCYTRTLDLCAENDLRSVAFCCISTGVFRFPAARAARIAVESVTGWLEAHDGDRDRVIFNVFTDADRAHYEALFM